jgi:hypothetical protein
MKALPRLSDISRVLARGALLAFGTYALAQGLPDTKVGTFTQQLYDEAKKRGWVVISMKYDWKKIFAFD